MKKRSKKDPFETFKSMCNGTLPGNNGLSKGFFKTFSDSLNEPLINSF